jgi:hypothetical protein
MVFNATFNNISVISWQSYLLLEETGVPRENYRPASPEYPEKTTDLPLRSTRRKLQTCLSGVPRENYRPASPEYPEKTTDLPNSLTNFIT